MTSQPRQRQPQLPFLAGLAAMVLVIAAIAVVLQSQAGRTGPGAPGTSAATASSENSPTYPADLLTYEAAERQTIEAVLLTHPVFTAVGTATVPPSRTPEPLVFLTGIFDEPNVNTMPGLTFVETNAWGAIINGEYVRVIAGAWRDNPAENLLATRGTVIVDIESSDRLSQNITTYDAPTSNTGPLTIIAETGYRLTLQAESGAVLYFDVPTRLYVESADGTVAAPTTTPLPTGAPQTSVVAPPPHPTEYPPDLTYEAGLQETRAASLLTSPPYEFTGVLTPRPSRTPEPFLFVTGIIAEPVFPPMAGMQFALSNAWGAIINGDYITIYAGTWRDDPGVSVEASQGTLIVVSASNDRYNGGVAEYDAPLNNTGLITVTAESGWRLTLLAASGAVFYFDVPTRQYVDSLAVTLAAPTVTALPTGAPPAPPATPTRAGPSSPYPMITPEQPTPTSSPSAP